jgi:pimeloyl-ACP methyl ester carboxylesterase
VLRAFADGALFGEQIGSATPLVLGLPGWQRTHADLTPILQAASPHPISGIVLDLPGFGASPPPPDGWTTTQYAEALRPVLDECADPVVLLAHSFGGRVALRLAHAMPDRIAGLVLSGVPMWPADRPRARSAPGFRLIRALRHAGVVSEARLDAAREHYGSADYRAATGVMREVLVRAVGDSYDEDLEAITAPISLVWGETDTAAPVALAERAVALGQHVQLEVLAGLDHLAPIRNPSPFTAALERMLAR